MDQGFWNDTYSYGGWDWGRPVLWIVFFGARADTCVSTAKRAHAHTPKRREVIEVATPASTDLHNCLFGLLIRECNMSRSFSSP